MSPFSVKDWQDAPSTATPLSASALEDMETRLSAYTDAAIAANPAVPPALWPAVVFGVDPRVCTSTTPLSSQIGGLRVKMTKTGTLSGIAVYLSTAGTSLNYNVGIYTPGPADPRTRLWQSGSLAIPATGQWVVAGNPGLAVSAGQNLDFVLVSNGNGQWLANPPATAGAMRIPSAWDTTIGEAGKLVFFNNAGAFSLPATISEASLGNAAQGPVILGLIT